jgi:hypothetical protein
MIKKELRIYYCCLIACLSVSLLENVRLWMLINPIFSIVSIYFYQKNRNATFENKDTFFITSLCCSAIQEFFVAQRPDKWSLLISVFFLFLMFFFFILSVQQEKAFLLFGRKNMFIKSVLIIFSAILCYVLLFLPTVPDYLVFPIFVHVFFMFFSFLISANRITNQASYNYVIAAMVMFVMTTIVAGISLFIVDFMLSYFWERLFYMLGISFITQGIIESHWIEMSKKTKNKRPLTTEIESF